MPAQLPRANGGTAFGMASIGLTVAALLAGCYLTIAVRAGVSPISGLVSDSVYYPHGDLAFVSMIVLMDCAGLCLLTGMRRFQVPRNPGFLVFFTLWQLALLLCAIFPENRTSAQNTFSGAIHWCAGAVLFASLPIACWQLLNTAHGLPAWSPLRALTLLSAITAASFGASQLPFFAQQLPAGLLQRIALCAEIVLLLVLASALSRIERQSR